jgi:hypothetical protein
MEEQIQNQPVSEQSAPTPPVPSKINSKLLTIIVLLVFLLMASGLVYLGNQNYQLQQRLNQFLEQQPSQTQPSPTPATIPEETLENTYTNQYLTFSYPKSWQSENWGIYEYRSGCDPDTFRCTTEKNLIEVRSNLTQIYQGYTNLEWFNKISNLTSSWESGKDVFTKLATGQTDDGKNYVIFKQDPSASFEGEALTLIIGYVPDVNNLHELRLARFTSDQDGIQVLKSIIETVKIK